ncbi:MAG: hypothetical protein K9I94_00975, partial [Bacteroidales bacterium]|nr:hypothetical protein [Bacteroidales bacterium]
SDLLFSILFSYGAWHLEENSLHFQDSYNNVEMIFKKEGTELIPVKSFLFLTDNSLKITDYTVSEPLFKKIEIPSVKEKMEAVKADTTTNLPKNGVYQGNYGFKLVLKGERKYEYWYRDVRVSKGHWTKENHILKMKDAALNHTFMMAIEDKYLIDMFYPGSIDVKLQKP